MTPALRQRKLFFSHVHLSRIRTRAVPTALKKYLMKIGESKTSKPPRVLIGRISSVPPGWKVQHAVPPHPGPLPWGEGELSATHSRTQRLAHYQALEMVHPLPEGEGWGEGEEGARPRINRWYCQHTRVLIGLWRRKLRLQIRAPPLRSWLATFFDCKPPANIFALPTPGRGAAGLGPA